MKISSASHRKTKPFGGSRRLATAHAKAAILKSDIQKQLAEKLGGFVWKVEMWPNWLSISVDALGNNTGDLRTASDVAETFAEENQEQLQAMFSEVLGDRFGELSIMGREMGKNNPMGSCCRTGCGGCLNGRRDKLADKLQDPPAALDKYG